MKKKQKPFLVQFLILTVITSILWAGFDIYRSFTTKPDPDVAPEILSPINPNLDKDVLDKLTKKVYLEESAP